MIVLLFHAPPSGQPYIPYKLLKLLEEVGGELSVLAIVIFKRLN